MSKDEKKFIWISFIAILLGIGLLSVGIPLLIGAFYFGELIFADWVLWAFKITIVFFVSVLTLYITSVLAQKMEVNHRIFVIEFKKKSSWWLTFTLLIAQEVMNVLIKLSRTMCPQLFRFHSLLCFFSLFLIS